MKNFIFLLFCIFSNLIYAREAVVIVFEAPLNKLPNDDSTVLQNIRKGGKIYVPASLDLTNPLPEYIETFDWCGNTAYIKSKYIKIVTNNELEKKWPMSIGPHDPTDYRIEEPIPPTYPFWDHSFNRVSLEFTLGENSFAPYNYGNTFPNQEYSSEKGGKLSITRKVSFDKTDRAYYGFILGFSVSKNTLQSNNNITSTESRTLLRVGPYFTYDVFKNLDYRLSMGTGATYNFHRTSIFLQDASGFFEYHEERIFAGTSISPLASIGLQMDNALPGVAF